MAIDTALAMLRLLITYRCKMKGRVSMPTPNRQPGQVDAGTLAAQALQASLPKEVQDLLKPGKTPERIQQAITWAARPDPKVLAEHRMRGHQVETLADIRNLKLAQLDTVAKHFARRFRRRALITGALTGLPGGLWALVAAGADVQLTAVYAVRMASDVAQAYGYDTSLIEEQAHLAEVLALAAGIDSLRGVGNWLAREGLAQVLPELLAKVLIRMSIELTEEQAAKLVGRLIPGVGAIIGGAIDYTFLRVASDRAMAYYHQRYLIDHGLAPASSLPSFSAPGKIVEGSAAPVKSLPAPAGAPATPVRKTPAKHRKSAPERFGIYLAIFAVFALFITALACWALGLLFFEGLSHLLTLFQ